MINKTTYIPHIKKLFQKMEGKDDFLKLLNVTKEAIYGDRFHPFSMKQLNYYTVPSNRRLRPAYTTFTIKKKAGGERTITAPTRGLKQFQNVLNELLHLIYQPHPAATGFVARKSVLDNASIHTGRNFVYNLDLRDFFPSIDAERVWGRLLAPPFHLGTTENRRKIANMIKALCCTTMEVERFTSSGWENKMKEVLPQGAPTSPILSNSVCERLDIRLSGVAKRFGLRYSRYADDITFSSMHNSFEFAPGKFERIFHPGSTFDKEVRRIITDQNFNLKESKLRLQKRGYRQEVTGITVNEKANVPRRYVKQLRQWIYFWERHGYVKAEELFRNNYKIQKGHIQKSVPGMQQVIEGKLLYLKMIKGDADGTYLKLKERFELLKSANKSINSENKPKPEIVELIHEMGLDKAMELYEIEL